MNDDKPENKYREVKCFNCNGKGRTPMDVADVIVTICSLGMAGSTRCHICDGAGVVLKRIKKDE